jgi:large subunit ribosomal protein L9
MAATLTGVSLTVSAKAGEGERLFGSITAQDIADALAAKGHPVDRRRIELEHPIKLLGTHTVTIRLHPEVHADVQLTVVAE